MFASTHKKIRLVIAAIGVVVFLVSNALRLRAGGPCDNFPQANCSEKGNVQCGLGQGAYCYKWIAD
jgi:hypothetical protein